MLWLALVLPALPLDALLRGHPRCPPEAPTAVVERRGALEIVCMGNAEALALGVRPGMKRAAALGLAGGLRCLARRPERERAELEALAAWCLQFTPQLSLAPPDALLLEIGGSLRYFGGLEALRRRLAAGLDELGHEAPRQGCAPTPLAALWRAQAGEAEAVHHPAGLAAALEDLPLAVLELPAKTRQTLDALGLRRLGELLALPSAGLAKRFGPGLAQTLDRALGLAADPRPGFAAPEHFLRRLELNWPVTGSEALLFVARRLFAELSAFLRLRGLAVQRLELALEHEHGVSRRALGLVRATDSAQGLLLIWREELARLALPAPVTAVAVRAEAFSEARPQPRDLFDVPAVRGDAALWQARMRARLGADAVRGLACVAEHRPERAWRLAEPGSESPGLPALPRPAWLLAEPERLPLREERPWREEPLYLQGRAERIESGWWDGAPIRRDYYLAAGPSGRRYWLFQDRHSLAWFLHGLFA